MDTLVAIRKSLLNKHEKGTPPQKKTEKNRAVVLWSREISTTLGSGKERHPGSPVNQTKNSHYRMIICL